jgi:hypothetical protein
VAVTAAEQETHTFRMQPRGHLFGGIVMVATAVILAAVIGAQASQSIVFRTLFGLGCLLYAWFGERLARARVDVHGGRLIVHDYLRTRTVQAGDVREVSWEWWRTGSTPWVVPRVHLADGGSIRLSGLWSYGSRRAQLAAMVEEILSLLGVRVPVQEQVPGQGPDRASAPDAPDAPGRPAGQVPVGLPSESVGVPRPRRQFRTGLRPRFQFPKGLRNWLPVLIGLTLGVLYIVSATVRVLVILLYVVLAARNLIRFIAGSRRSRAARPRPPARPG